MRNWFLSDIVLEGDSSTMIASSGSFSLRIRQTVEGLSGSLISISGASGSSDGGSRSLVPAAATRAWRVSLTSATIASPIGARAASSGSDVIATSFVPSARNSPGKYG